MADDQFDLTTNVKAWADAQSRMWESWMETARAGLSATSPAASGRHWDEVAAQGLEAWVSGATGLFDGMAEYFGSVTGDMSRLFEATGAGAATANGTASTAEDVGDTHESAFRQLADAWWDNYERTFGRLLASPSMGYTRELNERVLETVASWLQFRRASLDYELLLGEAWARSAEQFATRLAALAQEGKTPANLRELLRVWTQVTDDVLVDAFRSDRFAEVQGRLLDAAMQYRLKEREGVEAFLKQSHLPTRSDVDNLGRRVQELRRELREMRKAARQQQARKEEDGGNG